MESLIYRYFGLAYRLFAASFAGYAIDQVRAVAVGISLQKYFSPVSLQVISPDFSISMRGQYLHLGLLQTFFFFKFCFFVASKF